MQRHMAGGHETLGQVCSWATILLWRFSSRFGSLVKYSDVRSVLAANPDLCLHFVTKHRLMFSSKTWHSLSTTNSSQSYQMLPWVTTINYSTLYNHEIQYFTAGLDKNTLLLAEDHHGSRGLSGQCFSSPSFYSYNVSLLSGGRPGHV